MKPVAFDYARPATMHEAIGLLSGRPDAKVIAGGQTLGPMLNLRLAQPGLLVDVARISELASVAEDRDTVAFGAAVTHAAVEDGRVEDPTGGFLAEVAAGIAYRAVRTRGTLGGSLAHADPAADWLSCFTALGAEVMMRGQRGERSLPVARFVRGAMETALESTELITAIRVRRFSPRARFGFHKICRKTGEFAEAIGVAVHDSELGVARLVANTPAGAPVVLDGVSFDSKSAGDTEALQRKLVGVGFNGDAYELRLAVAALQRAMVSALTR